MEVEGISPLSVKLWIELTFVSSFHQLQNSIYRLIECAASSSRGGIDGNYVDVLKKGIRAAQLA